jgi:hypothetical protein
LEYSCYIAGVPLRDDGTARVETNGPANITLLENHTDNPQDRYIVVFVVEEVEGN